MFLKKDLKHFFACGGLFLNWSVKNILYPPLDNVCRAPILEKLIYRWFNRSLKFVVEIVMSKKFWIKKFEMLKVIKQLTLDNINS